MKNKRGTILGIILVLGGLIALILIWDGMFKKAEKIRENVGQETNIEVGGKRISLSLDRSEVVEEDLDVPWNLEFLPDGNIISTERGGKIVIFTDEKTEIEIEEVWESSEGGLLGLALDPDFEQNHNLYVYLTYGKVNELMNRVEKYELIENTLRNRQVILEGILGGQFHDGGRIAFGPDGYLYVTTGDAGNSDLAQDINSLNGKILRIDKNGEVPTDNLFGNEVYSYGHRNPQGITWDDQGRLWATEHGPSGTGSGFDELNLIEKGANYGWPVIQGDENQEAMVSPIIQSGSNETWAPSGSVFFNGSIWFGGLRGETLYEYKIIEKTLIRHFEGEWGRIRDVKLGPDGNIYLSTSNKDGRGRVNQGDDKIIRINFE